MALLVDLTGQRFGRLLVLSRVPNHTKNGAAWQCLCDCGVVKAISTLNLRTKKKPTRSCGCLHREDLARRNYRHGLRHTRIYEVWKTMIQRCTNPRSRYWYCYGGRGITVCEEWRSSAEAFIEWALANGYERGLTIDRLDNDAGYSPSNCQWITNAANTAKRNKEYAVNVRNR